MLWVITLSQSWGKFLDMLKALLGQFPKHFASPILSSDLCSFAYRYADAMYLIIKEGSCVFNAWHIFLSD